MAKIYRDSSGRLEWAMSMAREWANEAKDWHGSQGGWIYGRKQPRQNEQPICQGWGSLYGRYTTQILDWYTRKLTAFDSFQAMVTTPGHYRPTLMGGGRGGWRYEALADAYDSYQQTHHDPRRAYRGR